MKSRPPTVGEYSWLNKIVELNCIVCINNGIEDTPAVVHHIVGTMSHNCHYFTIPLCYHHHQGQFGFHQNPAQWQDKNGSQWLLLTQVYKMIGQDITAISSRLEVRQIHEN